MSVSILIVGPDGSGKSTVARQLLPRLNRPEHIHFRRTLRELSPQEGAVPPRTQPPRSIVSSAAKVLFQGGEAIVSSLLRPGFGRDRLIERGWHDQLLDPARYRLDRRVAPLVRWIGALQPRCDLMVVCRGDPEVMHARKLELEIEELVRQSRELQSNRTFIRLARHRTFIDTTSASVDQCLDAVDPWLSALRMRRHWVTPRTRRVFVSPDATANDLARLYRPQGRLAKRALLLSTSITGLSSRPPVWVAEQFAAATRAMPGSVAVAAISSSRKGRIVVLLRLADDSWAVAKVGRHDDQGMEHEQRVLASLAATPISPHVLHSSRSGHAILVLRHQGVPVAARQDPPDIEPVMSELARLKVSHGDLTPWNILDHDGDLTVVDWETAEVGGDGVDDLASFLVNSYSVKAWARGPARAMGRTLIRSAELSKPGGSSDEFARAVGRYVQERPDLRQAADELLTDLAGVEDAGSTSGAGRTRMQQTRARGCG